jgi:hypothetical protein
MRMTRVVLRLADPTLVKRIAVGIPGHDLIELSDIGGEVLGICPGAAFGEQLTESL